MFVVKCVKPAYFDVDDTLITWRPSEDAREEDGKDCNWLLQTLDINEEGKVYLKTKHEEDAFIPHRANIEQLKEHKRRGHTIIVWSAGGWRWAEQAIRMLGIEDYVDLVVEKPSFVYDDKKVQDFMPASQLIPEDIVEDEDEGKELKKSVASPTRAAWGDQASEAVAAPTRR